jgi:hypothetical protein
MRGYYNIIGRKNNVLEIRFRVLGVKMRVKKDTGMTRKTSTPHPYGLFLFLKPFQPFQFQVKFVLAVGKTAGIIDIDHPLMDQLDQGFLEAHHPE